MKIKNASPCPARMLALYATMALSLFWARTLWANAGDTFGLSSRSAALAQATTAWAFDGFAGYSNPAGLPLSTRPEDNRRMALTWSLLGMRPDFKPINGVTTTNSYTADRARTGDVDVSYRSTLGQAFGVSYRLEDKAKATLGLVFFLPLNQLAYLDTGEVYTPEYVLYRARTQRPQMELAAGAELVPGFHAGAGLHVSFGLTSTADVLLQSGEKPSTMKFRATLKPKAAPYFGFLFMPGLKNFSLGGVLRLPVSANNDMVLESGLPVLGQVVPFKFSVESAIFYDPLTIQLGTSWAATEHWRILAELDYQAWRNFKQPMVTLVGLPGGNPISSSMNPTFSYRDIVIPRLAHEVSWGEKIVRLGYAYRPSIFKDLPNGPGNYLDPPQHIVTAGLGLRFKRFLHFDTPCSLDFHAGYHHLVTQQIAKTPGDETGNPAESKIGAPGYDAGGKILGGGVSLSLAI
ncbi:MAG TPA: hypothetical protein VJB59_12240 [Bdellovibrionota bacterium]|nr:hypothetical protein [Bdellovibrionota bacterium]